MQHSQLQKQPHNLTHQQPCPVHSCTFWMFPHPGDCQDGGWCKACLGLQAPHAVPPAYAVRPAKACHLEWTAARCGEGQPRCSPAPTGTALWEGECCVVSAVVSAVHRGCCDIQHQWRMTYKCIQIITASFAVFPWMDLVLLLLLYISSLVGLLAMETAYNPLLVLSF